jgi:hypothetical protein
MHTLTIVLLWATSIGSLLACVGCLVWLTYSTFFDPSSPACIKSRRY